jgi:hypothetical protein
LYDDGRITCDGSGLNIRGYYPWGSKRIRYSEISSASEFTLRTLRGRWRLFGSGDFRHWYSWDPRRPRKRTGIELKVGRWAVPVITPEDPRAVLAILRDHLRTTQPRRRGT